MAEPIIVSSGVISSSIQLTNGMVAKIYNAGTAIGFTVNASGSMMVSSGGSASATTVGNMGSMFVSAGGIITNTVLSAGAVINNFTVASRHTMSAGVVIRNALVQSGNTAYLFSGQSAEDVNMSSGAVLYVSSGGKISNLNASSGAEIRFMDGITVSNAMLLAGAVINGFTVQSLTTDAYKISGVVTNVSALVNARRQVISATVNAGGNVSVTSAGVLSSAQIHGAVHVFSSGLLERAVNSGIVNVFGGTASLIDQKGLLNISSGGLVSGVTQFAGGSMNVDNSGVVSNALISAGSVVISAGGSMNLVTMTGGSMYVSAGAVENFDVTKAYVSVGNYYTSEGNDGRYWIIGAVSGVVSSAVIGSSGFMEVKQGNLKDVTVSNQGSVFMAVDNTVENLVISSGGVVSEGNYISAAYKTNNFSNTTVLSGGVLNGFTAVDSNVMDSGIIHRNVEVNSADNPAELLHDERVENGVVKSGGTIHLSSSTVASISDLTVESGGFIHVEEDAVLVLNGKTTLNNSGGIVLSRHIIHYTDFYSNGVDVFRGNVGTSCYSPVSGLLTAVVSGTSWSRSKPTDSWGSEGTPIQSYSIRPYMPVVDYTDNYDGGFYHSNVTFIPLNGMSSDGLARITGGGVVSAVWISNAGGSQARVRFDFTSTTLAPNEAMLNDISRVTPYDTGVDSKSLVPDQYHDDPRFEFVYTADLKDAYYLADGAEGFGVYQYDGSKYSHVYNETFRLVDSNGNALFPQQLNVDGNIISWNDGGIYVSAHLQKENSHLYMELYRNDPSSSATIDISERPSYFLTSDTVFAGDKTYYTYAGGVYTSAAVTSGTAIAADTYYEKKYTNADVVVAAQYSQNTRFGTKKYDLQLIGDEALNDRVYKVYDGVTFKKNGTVTFKGTGADANEVSETLTVDWIDKAAPTITCSQTPDIFTPNSVYVKATAEENTGTDEYAVSGLDTQRGIEYKLSEDGDWLPYNSQTGVLVEKNIEVYFRTWDMAGNMATQTHTVRNIISDLPKPEIFGVSPAIPTNQDVTISLNFDPYATAYQVSTDGTNYTNITGADGYVVNYTVTVPAGEESSTTYYFRNSYGGGIYSPASEIKVDIDKIPPEVPVVSIDTEEIVSKNVGVVLTADWNDDVVFREYSLNNVAWSDYTGPLAFYANQPVYFRGTDAVGNFSEVTYNITNIAIADAPVATPSTTAYTQNPVQITVSEVTGTTIPTMTYQYKFVVGGEVTKDWTEFNFATEKIQVTSNTDVHIRAIQTGTAFSSLETVVEVKNIDKSAPVIDSVSWDSSWTNKPITVTVTASDADSGVKSTEYQIGGDPWIVFNPDEEDKRHFTVTGNCSFKIRAKDYVGNTTVSGEYTIDNYDDVNPVINSLSWNENWTHDPVTVTVAASDALSGVAKIEYAFNGGAWQEITYSTEKTAGSFTLTEYGLFSVRVTDNAGNEVQQGGTVQIDNVNPAIDLLVWNHDWTNEAVTVSVVASDDLSGVTKIEYSSNGGAWQEITYSKGKTAGSFTLTENGDFKVRVTDNAGNEVQQGGAVQIDYVNPVINSLDWNHNWSKDPVTVTVTASDALSGVAKIEYKFNDSAWQEITYSTEKTAGSFTLTEYGTFLVCVTDNAGNIEISGGTMQIDNVNPVIDSLVWNSDWSLGSVTVSVAASDALSGVAKIEYTFEGSAWQEITYSTEKTAGSFKVNKIGSFKVRVTDNAGNEVLEEGYVADTTPPVIDSLIWNKDWTKDSVTVSVSASDPGSGVAKIEYKFKDSAWQEIIYSKEKTAGSFTLTEQGQFDIRVTDNVGNFMTQSGTVLIDKAWPTIDSVSWNPNWTNKPVAVNVTASDVGSGVAMMEYSFDGSSWTEFDSSFLADHNGLMKFRVTDKVGNVTESDLYTIENIDNEAPVAVLDWNKNWTNEPVTVSVTASDALSGVAKIEYTFNGSAWKEITYSTEKTAGSFTLTEFGSFGVRVTDNAGNYADQGGTAWIDRIAPTIELVDWDHSWTKNPVTVTMIASDAGGSGIKAKGYSLDGGQTWTEFTGDTFEIDSYGNVRLGVTDNAGNGTPYDFIMGNIDTVAPVINSLDWNKNWTNEPVTVSVTASDTLSGVAKIEYTFEGSAWQEITYSAGTTAGSFTLNGLGAFGVRVTDNVGNEVLQGGSVLIDTVKPMMTVSIDTSLQNPVIVTVTASDTQSGLARTEYSLDGGQSWIGFADSFNITENRVVKIRAVDNAGNITLASRNISGIPYVIRRNGNMSFNAAFSGSYSVAGDFGNVTGSISVANGGQIFSGTIHQGVLNIGVDNSIQLSAGETSVSVSVTNGSLYQYNAYFYSENVPAVQVSDDLNGDGRADVVMSIAQPGYGAYGSTGAWLIREDQSAEWSDLSTFGAGWEIFGYGRTVAGKNSSDIYLRSTGNVIGAWTTGSNGKVNGWETIGEFDANTQIVGLGDFNGNGQTDLLLRNINGAIGCYFTGGEKTGWNYFQSLGDEWKLSAIGDLNGDGRSDVVLKHDAGFAGSWLTQADGTMAWADLDTLSGSFEIAGSGDFNGDGTDDVLLKSGNYYGAWLVNNGNAAGWMGLGDLGDVSVEQIADFNGDGTDDLRIRTTAGDIGAQLVMGEDNLVWKYYGSVGSEWSTSLAALA